MKYIFNVYLTKKLLLILIIKLCFSLCANSQNNIIDIFKQINKANTDSTKVTSYILAAEHYVYNIPDSSIKYYQYALNILKKYKNKSLLAKTHLGMAGSFYLKEQYNEALNMSLLAEKEFSELADSTKLAKTYIFLGSVLYDVSSEKKSMTYYNKGLNIAIALKDTDCITNAYNDFAAIHNNNGHLDSALYYMLKVYELDKIRTSVDKEELLAGDEANIASLYINLRNNKAAEKYVLKAYERRLKNNQKLPLMKSTTTLASFYYNTDQLDKALFRVGQSYKLSKELGSKDGLSRVFDLYRNIYERAKNYKLAMMYADSLITLRNEIYNEEKTQSSNESEAKYQNDKKELENNQLQLKNELSEKVIRQQKIVTYLISIGLLLVITLSFFIFSGLKKQRNANKIISLQKQEVEQQKREVELQKQKVEEHQKEILDSIRYASRIQKALLPNEKNLEKVINRHKS
ncbi:MAG: hypothetical protein SFY56_11775 [Bacteroidota bacterium]|nr:hypothetical protein [Bacteroidota bacterium]